MKMIQMGGFVMERTPVSSSNIGSIGYDANMQILEIEFLSGRVYQYFGVPVEVYEGLMSAGSHGKFFNYNIRNVFPCEQVG